MPKHDTEAWRFESLIGSRYLLGAGLISLLSGAAFFVKVSNDNQWIPPEIRVLCGVVAGIVLMLGGTWHLGRQRTLIAEGVTGLGASVLYLALWGASGPLHVMSHPLAFAAMIAVSCALAIVAWRRRSQNVALAGLAGGFLTPALLFTGTYDPSALAVYLVMLCAAMLLLAVRCKYRLVEAASFAAALIYAPVFVPSAHWTETQSLLTASVLFAEFAAALFFAARREPHLDRYRIALSTVEVLAFAAVLQLELAWKPHALALADAALAVTLLGAVALPSPAALRVKYAWLGLGLLTRAIDVWGGTHALTATVAVEGAGLVFVGIRGARLWMRALGYALLSGAVVGASLHLLNDAPANAFLNARTWVAVAVAAALISMVRDARSYGPVLTEQERGGVMPLATMFAAALGLWAATADAVSATRVDGLWTTATQTTVSGLWSIAATLLIAIGFRGNSALVRWLGITLFAVTIGKVFVVDLTALDVTARAISALVLGAVLLIVAAAYQVAVLRGRRSS